jgi:hypothetical protein
LPQSLPPAFWTVSGMPSETAALLDNDVPTSIDEIPNKRGRAYIRCMLIERMRKRLSAGTGFIEPCLPSPADKPPSG